MAAIVLRVGAPADPALLTDINQNKEFYIPSKIPVLLSSFPRQLHGTHIWGELNTPSPIFYTLTLNSMTSLRKFLIMLFPQYRELFGEWTCLNRLGTPRTKAP